MRTGADLEERREQRKILRELYPDYDAKRHDVYVIRFNREQDEKGLREWIAKRKIRAHGE